MGDEQVGMATIIKDALMTVLPEDTPSDVICQAVRAVLAAIQKYDKRFRVDP